MAGSKRGRGNVLLPLQETYQHSEKLKHATMPGTRYRKVVISEHGNSEEHKQSVMLELLQRASWLQKEIEKKAEVTRMRCLYWHSRHSTLLPKKKFQT